MRRAPTAAVVAVLAAAALAGSSSGSSAWSSAVPDPGASAPADGAAAPSPSGPPLGAAPSSVPRSFVLTGGGWGHGVGMSQYGAQAQALAGRSVRQILGHYYRGTALAAAPDAVPIRVEVLGGARSATLGSRSLAGAEGGRFTVAAGGGRLQGRPGDRLTVAAVPGGVRATLTPPAGSGRGPQAATAARATVTWQGTRALPGGATVVDVSGAGGVYRHGTLEVVPVGGRLSVVNVVRLHDEYLRGVAEMPSSWEPAALQAQAVAARTYAVRAVSSGVKAACACHLYDEVRSQKFTGWRKEAEPGWGARWVAAVAATAPSPSAGLVATWEGRPIEALYFSSNGGRTENSEDIYSARLPYLRSVPDPWSAGARNPMALWTRTVTQAAAAAAFGLPDVAVLDLSDRTAGGSVRRARAVSSTGAQASLDGGAFRSRLGLPARWLFRQVRRADGPDAWRRTLAVADAVAPGARTVVLVAQDPRDAGWAWDGVLAAPLARAVAAPLLVVPRGTAAGRVTDAAVVAELRRRGVTRVVLVGRITGASGLRSHLGAAGLDVRRFGNGDRYATSAAVAGQVALRSPLPAGSRQAVAVALTSQTLDGALAAAAVAAGAGRPVLLVRPGSVPPAVADAARAHGIGGAVCVGGTAQLSEPVRRALPSCTRLTAAPGAALSAALARAVPGTPAAPGLSVVRTAGAALPDAVGVAALGQPLLRVGASAPAAAVRWVQATPSLGRLTVAGPVPAAPVRALQRS